MGARGRGDLLWSVTHAPCGPGEDLAAPARVVGGGCVLVLAPTEPAAPSHTSGKRVRRSLTGKDLTG